MASFSASPTAETLASFGKVLFHVAADISGSGSELSGEESLSESLDKKKRKRSD